MDFPHGDEKVTVWRTEAGSSVGGSPSASLRIKIRSFAGIDKGQSEKSDWPFFYHSLLLPVASEPAYGVSANTTPQLQLLPPLKVVP